MLFLLQLTGATLLLLFAVRMVRTGIERAMGPSFKRLVTGAKRNRIQGAFAGIVLAIILQSSAATALLATGFAASGLISIVMGLSIVLGADFGSALVIQVLSFKLDWLIPVLLAMGGWLFLYSQSIAFKQTGRILLGIAFILLALGMIGAASDPIKHSEFLPTIASYLESEYLTAFLVGALLTFIMHSSVAAILMFVTFIQLGLLPLSVGISMVLGANLGSAFVTLWLSRGMERQARQIPVANLILRGFGSLIALFVIKSFPISGILTSFGDGQALVNVHLIFNALLLIITLPFVNILIKPLAKLMPPTPSKTTDGGLIPTSALDKDATDKPALALASLRREVLRMGQIVEIMIKPVMELYQSGDIEKIKSIKHLDKGVNSSLTSIRRYVASLNRHRMCKKDNRCARELTEYAISLETAGDIVAKRLLVLAEKYNTRRLKFSDNGWAELVRIHERVVANTTLAFNVLISEDIESARLLIEEKTEMATLERKSRNKHLKRLRSGDEISFESSDLHLETLRALKDFNSQISAVAYPILYRSGQLLETRLVENPELGDEIEKSN